MIDFKAFLKYLFRYKWVIIAVPLLSLGITAYLLRDQPDSYVSETLISTGIVDQAQLVSSGQNIDYFKASQLFGNIIEIMKMKRVVSSLSYQLILHDLTQTESAFRPLSDDLIQLTVGQRQKLSKWFQQRLHNRIALTTTDSIEGINMFDIVASMGYDEKTLLESLMIERSGNSDFILVQFTSENPELSAFVVNTLAKEFILFYSTSISSNQESSLVLLDSLLKTKEQEMNERNAQLRSSKSASGSLDLNAQSQVVYTQIADAESRRSQAVQQIQSLKGAIARINGRLSDAGDTELGGNTVTTNNEVIQIEQQLEIANKRYVDNNFRPEDKRVVDSLTRLKTAKIRQSTPVAGTNSRELRQSLIAERMELETQLSLAENSVTSIQADLSELRSRYSQMVPADANVQSFEREADIATQAYMDALNRYNQASLQTSTSFKLGIAEPGLPGPPETSKKIIYLGLSSVASLSLCFSILFLTFILNRKVNNVDELTKFTSSNVIGNINLIADEEKDIREIWNDADESKDHVIFKELIRSLRFKIGRQMEDTNSKILGITGLEKDDGKAFLCASLAYAFVMTGKRVLLIGENYGKLSQMIVKDLKINESNVKTHDFETFIVKREIKVEEQITVLERNPNNHSLLEIQDEGSLNDGFQLLKENFDIILVDIASMTGTNSANEWLFFTDKSIAVYKAGTSFKDNYTELASYLKKHPGFMGWVLNKTRYEHLQRLV